MRVTFDIEADGLLEQATKVHCIAIAIGDEPAVLYNHIAAPATVFALLDEADTLVGHNIIAYDLPVLYKVFGWKPRPEVALVDTLILSHLAEPDQLGGHDLDSWGERVGLAKLPFEGPWDVYTEEMGTYCKRDVDVNVRVYNRLMCSPVADMTKAYEIEREFAKHFANQGYRGVKLDYERAANLLDVWEQEMVEIASRVEPQLPPRPANQGELDKLTPPKVQFKKDGTPSALCLKWFDTVERESIGNTAEGGVRWIGTKGGITVALPHSAPIADKVPMTLADQGHLKNWLMRNGWVPTLWSYKKEKDKNGKMRPMRDSEGHLIKSHPKLHDKGVLCPNLEAMGGTEIAKDVVRWVVMRHRYGLVNGIVNQMRPDGTVPATGMSLGTPTGRVTHSVVANIPKADPKVVLGTECRSIFRAREGRVLVGADASGLELRCLGHYIGSPEIIKIVTEGKSEDGTDIHSVLWKANGELVDSRNRQKNVTYCWLYGGSDYKIGETAGHPEGMCKEVGAEIRRRQENGIPGLPEFMEKIEQAAKRGFIKAIDDRVIPIRNKHATMNTLFQSCGSILVKMATVYMMEEIRRQRLRAWLVIHYHDEVQLDAHPDDAQAAGELFGEGLRWAGKQVGFRCPLASEVKVGANWSETH